MGRSQILLFFFLLSLSLCAQNFQQQLTFPSGSPIYNISTNSKGNIFVATADGLYRSTDSCNSWNKLNTPVPSINCLAINSNDEIFLGVIGIFCSTDNGDTWKEMGLSQLRITAITFNSKDDVFVVADVPEDVSVYRSTDNGSTWSNQGLKSEWAMITTIAINKIDQIIAIRDQRPENGVYLSNDDGSTWQLMSINVYDVAVFDSLNNLIAGGWNGINYSFNNGADWFPMNDGLMGSEIVSIAINTSGYFYVGMFGGGIFTSMKIGEKWTGINSGITDLDINVLTISADGYLFVGTNNGKLFRSIHSTTDIKQDNYSIPNQFSLSQNYPNPFNPTTSIQYSVISNEYVSLRVYDVLGNEVATLVNEEKQPGNYEVSFNTQLTTNNRQLSSGVYFYQLRAANFVQTKKMIVLK